jgi:uncharacterized protein YcbK (DUF882 family)
MISTRRVFLTLGSGLVAAAAAPAGAWAAPSVRTIDFRNLHTEERASVAYARGTRYLHDGLSKANRILRDWRTDEVAPIEPKVLDFVKALTNLIGYGEEVGIISGYRSPNTNKMLRQRGSGGIAKRSLHMRGMAIDIRLDGLSAERVAEAARRLRRGGVGLYSRSNFVHLDCGRVRHWGA